MRRIRNPQLLTAKAGAIFRGTRNIAVLQRQGKAISAHMERWALEVFLAQLDAAHTLDLSGQTTVKLPEYYPGSSSDYTPIDNPHLTFTCSFDHELYNKS